MTMGDLIVWFSSDWKLIDGIMIFRLRCDICGKIVWHNTTTKLDEAADLKQSKKFAKLFRHINKHGVLG